MAYNLDWPWRGWPDDGWTDPRSWGGFYRRAAVAVWVNDAQDARLLKIEESALNARTFIVGKLLDEYTDLRMKWRDGFAQKIVGDMRRRMIDLGADPLSTEFVACDRIAAKSMKAIANRFNRCLPLKPLDDPPTLRVAAGAYYDRPIAAVESNGRPGLSLGDLGPVFQEPAKILLDFQTAAYAEVARIETRWALRLTWARARDELKRIKSTEEVD